LFIDADIGFQANDVLVMAAIMQNDKEINILAAPYAKKTIKWANIIEAVKKHPNITPDELSRLQGDYVINFTKDTEQFSVSELTTVSEAGTGFLMIRRKVFEKFMEEYPQYKYRPDHVGSANFGPENIITAFFQDGLFPELASERFLSEDYAALQMFQKIGFKVHLASWISLTHFGNHGYVGDLTAIAHFLQHL
jgi:hypothetical protein